MWQEVYHIKKNIGCEWVGIIREDGFGGCFEILFINTIKKKATICLNVSGTPPTIQHKLTSLSGVH
jgi:hypothetical protein